MRPLALVTGGTSGIGLEIARKLCTTHDLLLVYKTRHDNAKNQVETLRLINSELQVAALHCDVGHPMGAQDIVAFSKTTFLRPVSVLINSAGHAQAELFLSADFSRLEEFIQVHLMGVMRLTHLIVPEMYRQNYGRIINFSSVATDCLIRGRSAYATAKAGVEAFTKSLALEVFHRGITVNAIKPGLIATPMTEQYIKTTSRRDAIPASDVAELAMYLLSPSASHITGSVMAVAAKQQEHYTTL